MMIKKGFTKIVNFMTCETGFFGARMWPYKSYNEHNESHAPHGLPEKTVKKRKTHYLLYEK